MYTVAVIGNATSDVMDLLGTYRFMLFRTAAQGADWRAQFDAIMQAGESDPSGRAAIQCENAEQTQYLLDAGAGKLDAHGDGAHVGEQVRALLLQNGLVRDPDDPADMRRVRDLFEDLESDIEGLSSVLFERIASRNLDKRLNALYDTLADVRRSARLVFNVPV